MACAPSEDSDQSGHPPSMISAFAVCMKKAWVLSYPLSAQRRLLSDWTDLSIRWAHRSFRWFCREVAHIAEIERNCFACAFMFWTANKNKKKWVPLRAMKTFIRQKSTLFRLIKPHQWLCNDPATKTRGNKMQFSEAFSDYQFNYCLSNFALGQKFHLSKCRR